MQRIDFKKELGALYKPSSKKVDVIGVPDMTFLMVDGEGDPNISQAYQEAVEALFGLSYALKFMIKKSDLEIDYGVLPLEGLWWADDMTQFSVDDKEAWKWTAMMMQPEFVTRERFQNACDQVRQKKNLPALSKIRFKSYHEGRSAQIMHIGPFSEEGPTIERLHGFIEANGYQINGKHHEIYLNDFRRTAPERLKTVMRQPIKPK